MYPKSRRASVSSAPSVPQQVARPRSNSAPVQGDGQLGHTVDSAPLRPPAPTPEQLQSGKNALRFTPPRLDPVDAVPSMKQLRDAKAALKPPKYRSALTPEQFAAGKAALKRTDYGVVHPELQGIRTRREGLEAHEFADLTTDARASTHKLMAEANGERMLRELNAHTNALPSASNGLGEPQTVANIVSGPNMMHSPRHNGTYDDLQKGYRYDGKHGDGLASKITYNPNAKSALRYNSLGHEGVHAWRMAHGLAVSPPEISPMRNDPSLQIQSEDGKSKVQDFVDHHAHMQEEFETVGLLPTPHKPNNDNWAPNENLIRAEHAKDYLDDQNQAHRYKEKGKDKQHDDGKDHVMDLPQRMDYSSETPARANKLINTVDEATDNRDMKAKYWDKTPSPVQKLLKHLED